MSNRAKQYRSNLRTSVALALLSVLSNANAEKLTQDALFDLSLVELMQIDVTVTSLFDTTQLNAPSTVSVITEKDWQRRGARRTLDAIGHLPETMILPINGGADVIAIRGYAQTTSARGIATTLDGIPLNNFSFGTGQYDTPNIGLGILDRIEMIRGPASALYGSDAFHGVLALHAFESPYDVKHITSEVGENGYYQGGLKYSTALDAPVRLNLAFAASGQPDQDRIYSYTNNTTHQQATARQEHRYHSQTASMKLTSDPLRDFSYRWGMYADRYQADGYPSASATSNTDQDSTAYLTKLALSQYVGDDRMLELSGYYRRSDIERFGHTPVGAGVRSIGGIIDEHRTGVTVTLKQPSNKDRSTQWAVAVSQENTGIDTFLIRTKAPDGAITDTHSGTEGKGRTIRSVLLEASTRFWRDLWQVVYGGRVDRYTEFGRQITPRLGLIFQPQPDTAIKLLYGNAFRAPTAAELYNTGSNPLGNPDLEPETIDSYELILMKQSITWTADATFFQNRWQDGISAHPPGVGTTYKNTGSNKSRGVALSLSWLPRPWRADFSGSYTKSENEVTEQAYRLFPRTIFNLGFGYKLGESNTEIYLSNRLVFNADEIRKTATNHPEKLPPYWRTDLHVDKKLTRDTHGFVNVKNLFDRNNRLPSVFGLENGLPDEPLSVSAGIRHDF